MQLMLQFRFLRFYEQLQPQIQIRNCMPMCFGLVFRYGFENQLAFVGNQRKCRRVFFCVNESFCVKFKLSQSLFGFHNVLRRDWPDTGRQLHRGRNCAEFGQG
jgi:hypothetical protein